MYIYVYIYTYIHKFIAHCTIGGDVFDAHSLDVFLACVCMCS